MRDLGARLQRLQLLASHKQGFVSEASRLGAASDAARAGRERAAREGRRASLQLEEEARQSRLAAVQLERELEGRRQERLATDSLELFARWRIQLAQSETHQVHEAAAVSQLKLVELEDQRVGVLWRVLADCEKHFFTPLECRELSRLYLHLKRATTA